MWLGTKEDFDKDKKLALILILSSIVSMIICTIVASISFGIYSTFTLFENIWLVLMLCVLKYTYKTKKNFRSHHATKGAYGKILFPSKRGIVCVRKFSVCIFLFLEVQNY